MHSNIHLVAKANTQDGNFRSMLEDLQPKAWRQAPRALRSSHRSKEMAKKKENFRGEFVKEIDCERLQGERGRGA